MSSALRILFVTPSLGTGGAEKLTAGYARGMHARGHEVGVAFGFMDSLAPEVESAGASLFKVSQRRLRSLTLPEWGRALRRTLRAFEPDVVHAQSVTSAMAVRLAAPRLPLLATIHGIRASSEPLASLLFRIAAVRPTTVSEATANGLRRLPWSPEVHVLGTGVDVNLIRARSAEDAAAPPRGRPNLCCVSRQELEKGVDVLVRAFAHVVRELPEAELTIVGTGSRLESNRALAEELGLAGSIRFTGLLANPLPTVAAADAVVLPSRREGLPIAVLEALALGRPVVATEVGGTPSVIVDGKTGWLAPPEDETALAEAIVACWRNRNEATRRADAGRRLVEEHYSAELLLDRIEQELRALAGPTNTNGSAGPAGPVYDRKAC